MAACMAQCRPPVRPFTGVALGCGPPSRPRLNVTVRGTSRPAPVAHIPLRDWDGSLLGSQPLSLLVADPSTSKGLVHRYAITVQQNKRAVGVVLWRQGIQRWSPHCFVLWVGALKYQGSLVADLYEWWHLSQPSPCFNAPPRALPAQRREARSEGAAASPTSKRGPATRVVAPPGRP